MKRIISILIFIFVLAKTLHAQSDNKFRKIISIKSDTLKIDSLSLIPNSLLFINANPDTADFKVDYINSVLIIKNRNAFPTELAIEYKVFIIDFNKTYKNEKIERTHKNNEDIITYRLNKNAETDIFGLGELQSQGSISRGISVGNSQDVSISSDFNLQLSGNIYEDLQIEASISDNNIPVQPQGNTQQLQEFDKVFIRIFNSKSSLIAGDFVMENPQNRFMIYNKNVQGAMANTLIENKRSSISVYGGAAISKGKYARNQLQLTEGNQGPYKLIGANNEGFIIVIAGSEKVFLDGELLSRGHNNDYVIDYNSAEISFTPKIMITKDSRIVVEFEYSDRNYASSLLHTGINYSNEKIELNFNFFDERDLKNQSVDQTLDANDKKILANVGDNLNLALVPMFDSVGFFNDRVLYKMIDTLSFDSIFVYSTNPDSAVFEVKFSFVGENMGDYVRIKSNANGKVFKWVAPVNGVKQGNYIAASIIISPKLKQMSSFGAKYKFSKNTYLKTEISLSNEDLNLFSNLDDDDNFGFASYTELSNKLKFNEKLKNWNLNSKISVEFKDANFKAIQRYLSPEFERNWNISNVDNNDLLVFETAFDFINSKTNNKIAYNFNFLNITNIKAYRNNFYSIFSNDNWLFKINASVTNNHSDKLKSAFIKHKIDIGRKVGNFVFGIKEEAEFNRITNPLSDSLLSSSFSFQEIGAYIISKAGLDNNMKIEYKHRFDKLPWIGALEKANQSNEIISELNLLKKKSNILKIRYTFRDLQVLDTNVSNTNSDKNSLGRIEHNLKIFKGAISINSFFESGTAMEIKREYSFIEIASGQGNYSWTDYNENGIKELDEFEIAAFQDQANYIRLSIPTNDFIKTYLSSFSTIINLNPYKVWSKSDVKFKKVLSKFSNNFSLRNTKKSLRDDFEALLNPLYSKINNSELMSLNFYAKNNLSFNKLSSKFGANLILRKNASKSIITNGAEFSSAKDAELDFRWSINKKIMFMPLVGIGEKTRDSEFLNNRFFNIKYKKITPIISYQPSKYFRVRFSYKFQEKKNNSIKNEVSKINDFGLDIKYNRIKKSSVQLNFSYVNIDFNSAQNSALAFEMLDALQPGDNMLWTISYQRTLLNNLQLNIRYQGRKPANNNTIHLGNIQIRAYF